MLKFETQSCFTSLGKLLRQASSNLDLDIAFGFKFIIQLHIIYPLLDHRSFTKANSGDP